MSYAGACVFPDADGGPTPIYRAAEAMPASTGSTQA